MNICTFRTCFLIEYLRTRLTRYLVVDLPCQSGTFTRWNYRPCSAAHPLIILVKFLIGHSYLKPAIQHRTPKGKPSIHCSQSDWYEIHLLANQK